jgi:hypothetical protein
MGQMRQSQATSKDSGSQSVANAIQTKLLIGTENDPLEAQADLVADKILRMPETSAIQRKCSHCDEEELAQRKPLTSFIQMKGAQTNDPAASDAVSSKILQTKGTGTPLPSSTQRFMESRFQVDFSGVQVHTGTEAIQLSQQLKAQAFTVGNDIYFNSGKFAPESSEGKHLLAHELTHTIQQSGVPSIQRRTYSDSFSTVAYLRGPIWNVRLTITNAPESGSQQLEDFIDACHDGAMSAARSMGESPATSRHELRIRIRYRRGFDSQDIANQAYDLAIASLPPRRAVPSAPTPPAGARHLPDDPADAPRAGETTEERIRRQARTTLRILSNTVADAGHEGFNRITLNIQNNGREIIPGFEKSDQMPTRPQSDTTSAYNVHQHLTTYFDVITGGAGQWEFLYIRAGSGMSFSRFQRVEPARPVSDEDELRALGIPNRREIYAQIFQQTEQQLQEIGIAMAGFTIEQIILYVAGGLIFRALGLLARGAISGFPRLMALVSRGNPAMLASGLEVLSTAERTQFQALMARVEAGALNAAEQAQLRGFLTRIEAALPESLVRAGPSASRLMSQIRIPNVTSLTGSSAAFDRELVRRAAEIRATQAGLSAEAFSSYNVAVARVRTASGDIVYLEAGNLPGAAHSEEYILGQLRDRAMGFGRGARVEQLYSERIPCSNCSDVIRRYFGESTEVFYTVGNQRNRGELLMQAYGL